MSLADRRRPAREENQGRQKIVHGVPAQLLESFSTPDAVGKLVRGAAPLRPGALSLKRPWLRTGPEFRFA